MVAQRLKRENGSGDRKKVAKPANSKPSSKPSSKPKGKGKGKAAAPPVAPIDSRFNSDSEDEKIVAPEELFDDSDEDMEPAAPSVNKGKQRATDEEEAANEDAEPVGKVKGRKGRAGGSGKKGKVFVEARSDLVALASSIANEKSTLTKARLAKFPAPAPGSGANAGPLGQKKEPTAAEIKKKERARALREAKKALVEKAKEKKRRHKETVAAAEGRAPAVATEEPAKKRVGFA